MQKSEPDLQKLTHRVIILSFIIAALYLGREILIPLAFALCFSLLLYPVCDFLEKKNIPRVISILITLLAVFLIILGFMSFFGTQFYKLFENLKDFGQKIQNSIDQLVKMIDESLFLRNLEIENIYSFNSEDVLGSSKIIEKTITLSTSFLGSLALIIVYTFLFLLYRTSFKNFITYHFNRRNKKEASKILMSIQKVAQNYFMGLSIIILILGSLNGLGLWAIGLDYPFLFGFFAAFLAVIPYIGTFIGGLIPFIYAIVNYDSIWKPILVIVLYTAVQSIEGNILTPKIVGSKVSLNPLFALISLILGWIIWGIAGMVLFIPLMAVLKVIFDHIDPFKPYGYLLGSDFGNVKIGFFKKLNEQLSKTLQKD